jgi:predicted MFS family arabinose efflux permease
LAATSLVLAAWARSYPEPKLAPSTGLSSISQLRGNRAVLLGTWIIILVSITSALITTLVPLRLARFGASTVAIGATFLVAAAISAAVAIYAGRVTDRRGSTGVVLVTLVLTGALVLVIPISDSVLVLALFTVLVYAGPMTAAMVPAASLLTVATEQTGLSLVLATMLVDVSFAIGGAVGAPTGAALAQQTSDAVPFACASALALATALLVMRWRSQPQVAQAAVPAQGALVAQASETTAIGGV